MSTRWTHLLPRLIRRRVEGRKQVQTVLGNITWLSVDKVLRLGVGLVVGVWVARYLGPELFGQLNFALAFVALFSPFASLGLDALVVRDVVREPERQNVTLGTSFSLRLLGSMVSLVAAFLLVYILRPGEQLTSLLVVIAGAAYLFHAFDVIDFWFQARVQAKYIVYARSLAFLIATAAKVLLILTGAGLVAFALVGLAEVAFGVLGIVVAYKRQGQSLFDWKPDWQRAKALLQECWPLLLSGISVVIYMRIDQVMLGYMLNDMEVGKYSVAIKIVEIWYFIPTAIAASVFPSILRTRSENRALYYLRIQKLFDVMTGLALIIAIPLSLLSTQMIVILFGPQYAQAGPILAVHVWAAVFVFLGVAQGCWDVAEDLTRLSMVRTMLGAVINIGLNFILIPRYQAMGAAFATVVSYAFSAYFLNVISPKTRPILLYQTKSFLLYRHFRSNQ